MRINWIAYNYRPWDGYGRYSLYCVRALRQAGHEVHAVLAEAIDAPDWLQSEWGIDWDAYAVSCLPPNYLRSVPAAKGHTLLTMTEGSAAPPGWVDTINRHNVTQMITPCGHNARLFARDGVKVPIHVVPGGTDPDEFPVVPDRPNRPYTFLALTDRGARKGWVEVWQAFYKAFGTPQDTADVALILKCRPGGNDMLDLIAGADDPDPRIRYQFTDYADIADYYRQGDCLAIPSRSEGWGMPHREAAMMGLPVITQRYSGMDDGILDGWALVVERGRMETIPHAFEHIAGDWRRADIDELTAHMRWCYDNLDEAEEIGQHAAAWLRKYQTWGHTAALLADVIAQ